MPNKTVESAGKSKPPARGNVLGTALVRLVVPLWVLTGAMFKLVEAKPRLLPRTLLDMADGRVSLELFLATLIGLEFLAAAVMLFIRPLARAMATFMLVCFCAILLAEIMNGSATCGCLGAWSPSPWVMLAIDGTLLLGVLLLKPGYSTPARSGGAGGKTWLVCALLLTIAGFVVSFARLGSLAKTPDSPADPNHAVVAGTQPGVPLDPTINPAPRPLPSSWLSPSDPSPWVGQKWRDLDIFQYMPRWPKGLDHGKHYVVFYSRSCEHCEAMFNNDLTKPLDAPVHAIEIPVDRDILTASNAWPMPETTVEHLSLPLGPDWIFEAPFTLALQDGIVTCATKSDHRKCMGLPPLPQ